MAIKFLNNIQAEAANTPDIIVKDTTNNLIGRLRAANNYVYLTADHGDAVGSTRITFQVDGNAVGFFSNSLFSAETDVKFSTYGSGNNTGTLAYALAVDANGNVIESTIQSNPAGVDGTGTVDYLTKWLDGDTLTDSNVYEASGDLVTTLNLKSSNSYPQLKLTDTDNSSTSSIRSAGGTLQHVLHDNTKAHVFYAGGTSTELMRITGDGLVGIGQSNPVENLEIYDADANTWVVVETGLNNAGTQYINTTSAWTVGIKANDSDSFYIGNQEGLSNGYLILDTSGNLQLTSYTTGYLKSDADGNITVDTSIIEDTLDSVTDRNATTTNAITVGGLTVDTDTLHVDATNNRVGINTTAPVTPLHIAGGDSIIRLGDPGTGAGGPHGIQFGYTATDGMSMYYRTTPEYLIWEDSMGESGSGLMVLERAGNLGIGNTAPSEKLHVTGNVRVTGAYYDSNNSPGLSGQILSSTATGTDWVSLSEIQGVDGTGTANYLAKWSDIDTITDSVVYDDGTNVGIGTTSPYHKLHVKHNSNAATGIRIENSLDNNGTDDADAAAEIFFQAASNNAHLRVHGSPTDVASEHQIDLGSTASTSFLTFSPSGSERVRIASDGNVGIGTTSPNYKLHVDGSVGITEYLYHSGDNNTYLRFSGDRIILQAGGYEMLRLIEGTTSEVVINDGSRDLDFRVESDTNTHALFLQGSSGQLGIGTASPQEELEVKSASFTTVAVNTDRNSAGENIGSFAFYGKNNAATPENLLYSRIMGSMDSVTDGSESGDIYFQQINSGTIQETFRVNADGSVRLNTYTTGVLVTDASGNVSASTDYHTQDTADARYVNVTGDTMTGVLNISSSTDWGTATTEALTIKNTGSGGDVNAEHSLGRIRWQTNGVNAAAIDAIRDVPGQGNRIDIAFFTNVGASSTTLEERMRINYDGRVGIGIEDPDSRLAIKAAAGEEGIKIRNVNNQDTFHLGHLSSEDPYFQMKNNAGTAEVLLRCDNNVSYINTGNLGIGTTSPGAKLEIDGSGTLLKVNSATAREWYIDTSNPDQLKKNQNLVLSADPSNSHNNTVMVFNIDNDEKLRIQDDGNVGIGTTLPNALLDVNKSTIGEYAYFGSGSTRQLRLSSYNTVSDHAGHKINASSGNGEITLATNSVAALTVKNDQTVQLNAYGAGYVKSDASGNLTVDNSTFLQEEVDTLASVTGRGATTSEETHFNGKVNVNSAGVSLQFGSSSDGSSYTPVESTVATERYWLRFDNTNDASFPYLTNRTPSGAVVIKTGTAAGGAENEHFRIKGGDGIVDAYFTNANVGIGTSSPTYKLDVAGNLRINEGNSFTDFDIKSDRTSGNIGGVNFVNASDEIKGQVYGHTDGSVKIASGGTSVAMTVSPTGDVGIGTTDPGRKLHVNAGNTNHVAIFESTDATAWIQIKDNATASYISNTANGLIIAADTNNEGADSNIRLLIDGSDQVTIDNNGDLRLHGYGAGYLKTDASGNITLDTITSVVDGTGSASYIPKWSDSDTLTDSVIYESSGSIGIGTESPTGILEVSQNLSAAETIDYPLVLSLRDDANSINQLGGEGVGIKFRIAGNDTATPGNSLVGASIAAIRGSSGDSDSTTHLAFFTSQNDETLDEAVRITSDGNVGIGTDAPSHKLTINTGTSDIYIDEDTNINQGTGSSDTPAIYADSVLRIRQRVELWDDNDGNNYLDIRDGSTQAIKLTPDNDSWITHDLGLGTTSPDGPLHIVKTSNESVIIENSDASGNSDDLLIKNTNDRDVGIKLETGGGYYHIALDSNGDDSLVFHLADINEPNFEFYQNGNLQLHQYGAGFLKTDANGLVSVDTASYTEAQTLDDVTTLGATTTNDISVGSISLSNDPASNNGTFVKVYEDTHKRMYTANLNFSFTAAGTYNFNLVFPNSGGYQYELTAVNSRNGLYRNFGTLKDSSYIYWESDEDFTHRAEGDVHLISSLNGGMNFSADTTYFLSDGVTDTEQTGTANWSYAIVRYSVYIPYYAGDTTGTWKLHLTTYGDTGSSTPQFVLA